MAGTDTPTPAASPEKTTMPTDAGAGRAPPAAEVGIGRRTMQQLVENPLQSLFGAAIIALLTFTLTTTHARFGDINQRIDDQNAAFNARIDDMNARITRLEDEMNARFEALEASVAEINLKLTALIAALNMSAQVEAAEEGRLIDPEQSSDPD